MAVKSKPERLVGITVLPEYIQSEGIDAVLHNVVDKAHATAVTTSPYLMEEATEIDGQREPPDDGKAGDVRLLDRSLWNKRELWVRTVPSFVPNTHAYRGLRYQPSKPSALTHQSGRLLNEFIEAAHERGILVLLQIQAAIPPGYRVQFGGPDLDDRPRLPDGRLAPAVLCKNGSLASPEILAYQSALISDLCHAYPDIDGLRFDWPEYPPYFLDTAFTDFGSHAGAAAKRLGFDFEAMRRDAQSLYKKLHGGLSDRGLSAWLDTGAGLLPWVALLTERPGLSELARFKAALVKKLVEHFRQAMDEAGAKDKQLLLNAFPPPWNAVSGMDYHQVAPHSTGIGVKLYTMHWPMMIRAYGDQLLAANPDLSSGLLARTLAKMIDIDDDGLTRIEDYTYPPPNAPHPVGAKAQARKIRQAQSDAGRTPVFSLAHGYGPIDDFERRLRAAYDASTHGVWINRYGYLSDTKLDVIGSLSAGKD